ncbi:hypothetical protein PENTCL1PPCAC_24396, partial [Pristionchus entomophagus]
QVVIVSVAGAFRKGKSFLLNFFLEYLYALNSSQQNGTPVKWLDDNTQVQGFHWRSGASRDTEGIWMWGEPILIKAASGEKLAVVLMDTQGAFDSQSTYQQCTTIFTLSTIVSSLQIYNVVDAIQEDALQNLTLFVKYGQMAMEQMKQFGTPFQTLCYCVRDFKAPQEYPFGNEGGQKYMEDVLNTYAGQPDELRLTRDLLSKSFSNLLCYLLPYPGMKVAERRSFKGDVRDIRSEFREEVRKMAESLLSPTALQPKIINGKPVTCKKLIECFKVNYSDGESASDSPLFACSLASLTDERSNEAIDDAKTVYCTEMDKAMKQRSLLSEKKLLKRHTRSEAAAMIAYDRLEKRETKLRKFGFI